MGKKIGQTLHKRRYTYGQYTYDKILIIISYKRNAWIKTTMRLATPTPGILIQSFTGMGNGTTTSENILSVVFINLNIS